MFQIPILYAGVRIYEDFNCYKTTDKPNKAHTKTRSMRESYHKRIQKKWTKRFGFYREPTAYQTPIGIVCHPSIADKLRRATAAQMNAQRTCSA